MKWETWEAIAKRQAAYKLLLGARVSEWPDTRVAACTDLATLAWVIKLTERVERHQQRMDRHMARALAALPDSAQRPN